MLGPIEPAREFDIAVENHLSIVLVRPLTDAGRAWIDENVDEARQEFAGAVVVEPRYVRDLVEGMFNDGLNVEVR